MKTKRRWRDEYNSNEVAADPVQRADGPCDPERHEDADAAGGEGRRPTDETNQSPRTDQRARITHGLTVPPLIELDDSTAFPDLGLGQCGPIELDLDRVTGEGELRQHGKGLL